MSLNADLWTAAFNGHCDTIKELVRDGANLEYIGSFGATPLSIAAEGGTVAAVTLLLILGANPNAERYATGATPIITAATKGYVKIVEELTAKGANLNHQRKNGMTALHMAVSNRNIDAVRALIKLGADASIKDNEGKTALDLAKSNSDMPMIKALIAASGGGAENGGSCGISISHMFEKASFSTPTRCHYCSGIIWGPMQAGFCCQGCAYRTHKNCHSEVAGNCTGIKPKSKDRKFLTFNGQSYSVKHLFKAMFEDGNLKKCARNIQFQTYDCFNGPNGIEWLQQYMKLENKDQAQSAMRILIDRGDVLIVRGIKCASLDDPIVWLHLRISSRLMKRAAEKRGSSLASSPDPSSPTSKKGLTLLVRTVSQNFKKESTPRLQPPSMSLTPPPQDGIDPIIKKSNSSDSNRRLSNIFRKSNSNLAAVNSGHSSLNSSPNLSSARGNKAQQSTPNMMPAISKDQLRENPFYNYTKLMFDKFDPEKQGFIDCQDFGHLCYDLGVYMCQDELKGMYQMLNIKRDSRLDFDEFFVWFISCDKFKKILDLEERVAFHELVDEFRHYDLDNSGSLDIEEFEKMYEDLGFGYSKEEIADELKKIDLDGNGEVEFSEYLISKGY